MLVNPGQHSDAPWSPKQANTEHLDLHDVVRILRRRKRTICVTVLLLTLLAIALAAALPKRYTAAVEILIEPPEKKVVETSGVVEEVAPQDQGMIDTEVKFLTSRSFVHQAAERMALANDPEFNPSATIAGTSETTEQVAEQEPRGWLDRWLPRPLRGFAERGVAWLNRWLPLPRFVVRAKEVEPPSANPQDTQAAQERVVDILLKNIAVEQAENAYVIRISATSRSPDKAAEIANTMADLYVFDLLKGKQTKSARVVDWLKGRLEELRKQLIEADQAVATYKKENHLIDSGGRTPSLSQLNQLTTQMALAQAERAEAEARLAQLRGLMSGGISGVAGVLTSPLLASLRAEEATLARRRAELAGVYGERHPQMLNLQAEFQELRQRMEGEAQRIMQDLTNELTVARAREGQLRDRIEDLSLQVSAQDEAGVELKELERNAEATRTLYTAFLSRLKEIEEQHEIIEAGARVISTASPPREPSFPRPKMAVGAGFAGSLMLAAIVAFVVESLDRGMRDSERIERMFGLRTLAFEPKLEKRRKDQPVHHQLLRQPRSAFSGAIRSVQMDLMLSHLDQQLRVVIVTSSLPGEGKTTLALSLAAAAATAGYRAAMLDLDLHCPGLRKAMHQPLEAPGVIDYLAGEDDIDAITYIDPKLPKLHAITVGRSPHDPTQAAASPRLANLVREMRKRYDFIVLDAPPVLAVKDVQILTRLADATLFVIKWQATKEDAVRAALRMLGHQQATIAGAVLTQVDLKRHAKGLYGDSVQYIQKYNSYYSDKAA
jgi:capsular exopolysaccharide synthesis family protein